MKRNEAIEVYNSRAAKFINTQSIQWKMNISIWTLLALAIFYKDKMNFSVCCGNCLRWEYLMGLLMIFIHGWFCFKVQKSLDSDKAVNDDITKQLNENTDNEMNIKVDLGKQPENFKPWDWIIIQVSITIVLVIIFSLT